MNANASNPHYEPKQDTASVIKPGDIVLIDMWAKLNQPEAVYYDITWMGFCGQQPPSRFSASSALFATRATARSECAQDAVAAKRVLLRVRSGRRRARLAFAIRDSPNISSIAPAIPSARTCTAPAPTWIISKLTTSAK